MFDILFSIFRVKYLLKQSTKKKSSSHKRKYYNIYSYVLNFLHVAKLLHQVCKALCFSINNASVDLFRPLAISLHLYIEIV